MQVHDGRSHQALAACDAVLIASGTATLEALYRPFKPKRRTRGQIAIEAGLEPLAEEGQLNLSLQTPQTLPALTGARGAIVLALHGHAEALFHVVGGMGGGGQGGGLGTGTYKQYLAATFQRVLREDPELRKKAYALRATPRLKERIPAS